MTATDLIMQATDANTGGGAIAILNNLGLPVIDSCTFTANYGPSGGAVFMNNAGLDAVAHPSALTAAVGVLILDSVIQYNDAYAAGAGRGGGVFGEAPVVSAELNDNLWPNAVAKAAYLQIQHLVHACHPGCPAMQCLAPS